MIQLYRKGTSHIIRGVTCEMITVSAQSYRAHLDAGWYLTPKEAVEAIEKVPEVIKEPVKEVKKVKESPFKNLANAIKS